MGATKLGKGVIALVVGLLVWATVATVGTGANYAKAEKCLEVIEVAEKYQDLQNEMLAIDVNVVQTLPELFKAINSKNAVKIDEINAKLGYYSTLLGELNTKVKDLDYRGMDKGICKG